MKRIYHIIIIALVFFLAQGSSLAQSTSIRSGETVKGIQAEGACAIVGMSAEQSQLTALQRARAAAIEQAAGVSVSSGTLVTNYVVAVDFIKTYARGFIIKEKVTWLPLGQYQKDASVAPIPEYRVRITADIYVPQKTKGSVGLKAKLNNMVFRSGEKATFFLRAAKSARFAAFNIMADDRVAMIFPNIHESDNLIPQGREMTFPAKDAKIELEVQTLPGHQRDAEAYLIIAWDSSVDIRIMELFPETEPLGFSEFFGKLAEIADRIEDTILPYEVVGGK
ncbi:MAG: DUF4384 domain-containing protein [Syntrophus sp. (in: bacteria)]